MILVDTSVWVDFFRAGDGNLAKLLDTGEVTTHDFVLGELACGNLRDRERTLANLLLLPRITPATTDEVLFLISHSRLYGRGLGWFDMHLLAAARMAHIWLYTRDHALASAAEVLGVSYVPVP
jgi:predicted nucleic acid-binding protein